MSVLRKLDRCLERFLSIMDGIAAISVFGIMLLITAVRGNGGNCQQHYYYRMFSGDSVCSS